MTLAEVFHGRAIAGRRVRVLAGHAAERLPAGARVLDVGAGDGRLAAEVARLRPDVTMRGTDVLVRAGAPVPIEPFDGKRLPAADGAYDAALLIDVVHHADDPLALLRETARVARRIVIKDHLVEGWAAVPVLSFMDRVGNARYGVALPHTYWTRAQWREALEALGLEARDWSERLGLYPPPVSWVCERSLHFVASFVPRP